MANLTLKNIKKSFGGLEVVHGIDLHITSGEFVVFVGPSGCGKSTLLRMIAGLEPITDGDLLIGDQRMNDVAAANRGIAMVFQSYALYPHMSVYKNMSFGLETAKMPKADIDQRVTKAAEILQITHLLKRKPKELSGGQRQRVAIGRAIVREPEIFLFDEPLSNLDAELRVQTRVEIAKLHNNIGATMIYVTHDQVEAMTLADRIVVLRGGIIEQHGSPLDIYNKPINKFVAGFIGSPKMNFLNIETLSQTSNEIGFQLSGQNITLPGSSSQSQGHKFTLGLRPEHIEVNQNTGLPLGTCDILHVEHLGGQTIAYTRLTDGQLLTVALDGQHKMTAGDTLNVSTSLGNCHLFDESGLRVSL